MLKLPLPENVRIASFDMGRRNFAVYVEDVPHAFLKKARLAARKLSSSVRHSVKRRLEDFPQLHEQISEVCLSGTRVHLAVYDIQDDSEEGFGMKTRRRLVEVLDSLGAVLATCDIAVLEQQYVNGLDRRTRKGKAGGTANFPALKVGEAVATWLTIRVPWVEAFFFGASFKTQILGAPPEMTKPERKRWAVERARKLMEERGDAVGRKTLQRSKADDLADTILMAAAFKWKGLIIDAVDF